MDIVLFGAPIALVGALGVWKGGGFMLRLIISSSVAGAFWWSGVPSILTITPLDPTVALGVTVGGTFLAFVLAWTVLAAISNTDTKPRRIVGLVVALPLGAGIGLLGLLGAAAAIPNEAAALRQTPLYASAYGVVAPLIDHKGVVSRVGVIDLASPLEPIAPAPDEVSTTPARPIVWDRVKAVEADIQRVFAGTVRAGESVDLAFEVGGDVIDIAVRAGARVQAGQIVARLDGTPFRLELAEREAALADAKARLQEAESIRRRKEYLNERGVESEAALDNADAAAASARAQVDLASAAVDRAKDRVSETQLIAPYAGRIAAQLAELSQVVRAGEPVLRIEDETSRLEIVVEVPEDLIDRIEKGQVHSVNGGNDPKRRAVVTEIGTRARGTATFPVTLTIEEDDGLRVGMTRRVRLSLPLSSGIGALRIPSAAINVANDRTTQIFAYRDGAVVPVDVDVLQYEGETARIKAALEPGDIVATRGVAFLSEGQPVTLLGTDVARFED